MAKPDPERIWLQNAEDAKLQCEGRLWCEDKVWPAGDDPEEGEPTEYIRSDIHARALLEAERRGMERAAKIAETGYWSSALGDHVPNAIATAIRSAAKDIEP